MRIEQLIVDPAETASAAIRHGAAVSPAVRAAHVLPPIGAGEINAYLRHQVVAEGLIAPAYPLPLVRSEISRVLACRAAWRHLLDLGLDAGLVVIGPVPAQGASLERAIDVAIASLGARDLIALDPPRDHGSVPGRALEATVVEEHRPHEGIALHLVGCDAAELLLAATDAADRPVERLLGMQWIHGVRELHVRPAASTASGSEPSLSPSPRRASTGMRGVVARMRLAAYDSALRRARAAWHDARTGESRECSAAGIRKRLAHRLLEARPSRAPSAPQRLRGALSELARRRWPAAALPLPSAILAGAMRSGTTSLFSYLSQHPQVVASRRKEVHFFDLNFDRGSQWYRRQFPGGKPADMRRLEATPYYMFDPRVPERMRELMPDARIVCLLRDPVERALSHYRKNRRDGREPLSFSDALCAEEDRLEGEEERLLADPRYRSPLHQHYSYCRRGYYADQIVRWHSHFPRDQVLLLDAGALFAHPGETLAKVATFLELDRWDPPSFAVRNSTSRDEPLPDPVRERWTAHFAPHERRLESMIGWCPSRAHGVS